MKQNQDVAPSHGTKKAASWQKRESSRKPSLLLPRLLMATTGWPKPISEGVCVITYSAIAVWQHLIWTPRACLGAETRYCGADTIFGESTILLRIKKISSPVATSAEIPDLQRMPSATVSAPESGSFYRESR
ncbi:MAG: hypothetical protein WBN03_09935 [Desulfobacterales bacterium]